MILHSAARIREYTTNGWWGTTTVDDLFRALVAAQPDREALVDPLNRAAFTEGEPRRYTYTQLDVAVNRVAARFVQDGLGKDDVIAVQLPNTVDLVVFYLAVARIGAIATPFAVQYREYELETLGNHAEIKAFVTAARIGDRANADAVIALQPRIPSLRTIYATGTAPHGTVSWDAILDTTATTNSKTAFRNYLKKLKVDANEVFTICWTSGTESVPKGVPRTHNDWIAIAYGSTDGIHMSADDRMLNPFPLINMAGIGGMLVPWLLTGSTLVMHHPFDMPTYFKQIAVDRITYTLAPPALLTMLLMREEMLKQVNLSTVRVIGSGSAPLSPFMVKTWQEKYGIPVTNFFGSNEGIALIGDPTTIPDPETRALYFPRFGMDNVDWGVRVARGMQSRLVDPGTGMDITTPNVPGEIRIKGPTVFAGYYKADDLTANAFDEQGFFRTGDVFEIAGDGDQSFYYRYVDRLKDIIIRGGMNISAAEVENHLQGHPKIAEVAVVGYPDQVMGERACVFVVPRPGETVTLEEVVNHLQQKQIAIYKLPERLQMVAALPRNPVGKILKRELRTQMVE